MGLKLNLKEDKFEDLGNARPSIGWYKATIEDVKENNETGNYEFDFRITGPTFSGAIHKEFLNNPETATTDKAQQYALRKCKDWAKRLGLITAEDCGRDDVEIELAKAVGMEVVVRLKDGSYTGNDGKLREKLEIDWAPYPLDHQGISADARKLLGLPLLPGQVLAADQPKPGRKPREKAATAAGGGANGSTAPAGEIDVSDL